MVTYCILFFFLRLACHGNASKINNNNYPGVRLDLDWHSKRVVLDNGIIRTTLSIPAGDVIGIEYNGVDNILDVQTRITNRGYWDVYWNRTGLPGNKIDKPGGSNRFRGTYFRVITKNEEQVEVSFTRRWQQSMFQSEVPLHVDKRYILRKGSSGIYMYNILEREEGWPDVDMDQIRVVFKLRKEIFNFMAISDDIQRRMPTNEDFKRGKRLAFPEAVLLTNPSDLHFRGEVDDKYQYSMDNKDIRVHGWISERQKIGFWMITPSDEFRAAGPIKRELTSHVGPTVLNMFTGTHYAGKEIITSYRDGEPWKKVLGPIFVYLNSINNSSCNEYPSSQDTRSLWSDAKEKMSSEMENWPYDFVQCKDLPSSNLRGTITGQLLVRDRYINERLMRASYAYVGLAAPGEIGFWQKDVKGYQFWTRANEDGYFSIKNVRPGKYNLYSWVPGIVGDYRHKASIIVKSGSYIRLDVLVFNPPRDGPTLWEIGIPDRSAAEFFVPDAYPYLMNKMYAYNHHHRVEKYRQYGIWERYGELYPDHDLIYDIGISSYNKDWFYAQVTRIKENGSYVGTTWQIRFDLKKVIMGQNYTLQLALAASHEVELEVRFNERGVRKPHFTTKKIGGDNCIARHGIHGLYRLYSINVHGKQLRSGKNTIYLSQLRAHGPFVGLMYDYIRLEGPSQKYISII